MLTQPNLRRRLAAAVMARSVRRHGSALQVPRVVAPSLLQLHTVSPPAQVAFSTAGAGRNQSKSNNKSKAKGGGGNRSQQSMVLTETFDFDILDDEGELNEREGHGHEHGDPDLDFGYALDDDDDLMDDSDGGDAVRTAGAAKKKKKSASGARHGGGHEQGTLSADEKRELAAQFRAALDRKMRWMQQLVAPEDASMTPVPLEVLLRIVHECYEPLYNTHDELTSESCSLWTLYGDNAAVLAVTTRYQPKWYDDQATKLTEQEAMALLVQSGRPKLALALFDHRQWLGEKIGITREEEEGAPALNALGKPVRSFYSWAMGASSALHDHARVFRIYEQALAESVFPTANMTVTYLTSLLATSEFEAVDALFREVQRDDRPVNRFFYRQMLFFTRTAPGGSRGAIMREVVDDMKVKGFRLRMDDYLNAIRTLDEDYFIDTSDGSRSSKNRKHNHAGKNKDKPGNGKTSGGRGPTQQGRMFEESYRQCVARIDAQERRDDGTITTPAASWPSLPAAEMVVQLFDEMVHEDALMPRNEQFFSRVITAAMLLQDYDRIMATLELHDKCFQSAMQDPIAIRTATNAFLLQREPERAWAFVMDCYPDLHQSSRAMAAVSNVLEYALLRHEPRILLRVLAELDNKRALSLVSNEHRKTALPTLCRTMGTDVLTDDELWDAMQSYARAFPVLTKPYWLLTFVRECCHTGRWPLVMRTLEKRDVKQLPTIPGRLALVTVREFAKQERGKGAVVSAKLLSLVAITDVDAMTRDGRATLGCELIRALDAVGGKSDGAVQQERHAHDVHAIYETLIRPHSSQVPRDIRELLAGLSM